MWGQGARGAETVFVVSRIDAFIGFFLYVP